jgi:hypothetical protein
MMISSSVRVLAKTARLASCRSEASSSAPLSLVRLNSTQAEDPIPVHHALTPDGDVVVPRQEIVRFPSSTVTKVTEETTTPVLLNSKEHAVGYLSKILNARVYDAAIETELQEAKNLSTVRIAKASTAVAAW